MKIKVPCHECTKAETKMVLYEKEIEDNGIYKYTCEKGHQNLIIFNLYSFQILFDLGIMSLKDGYTREAISSFAASVERFHEFCINIFLYKLPVDQEKETWKLVAASSERQLGAFYYLFLNHFKKTPNSLPNSAIKFRNDVIHKGKIPKFKESLNYAQIVFKYITDIILQLKENGLESEMLGLNSKINYKYLLENPELIPHSISVPTFINFNMSKEYFKVQTFEENWSIFQNEILRYMNA